MKIYGIPISKSLSHKRDGLIGLNQGLCRVEEVCSGRFATTDEFSGPLFAEIECFKVGQFGRNSGLFIFVGFSYNASFVRVK